MTQQLNTMRLWALRIALIAPFFFFTSCADEEIIIHTNGEYINIDDRVSQLIIEMLNKNLAFQKSNGSEAGDCTAFVYPMTFFAFDGDVLTPVEITVNSDEELLTFFTTTLTPENPYFIHFPVNLVDSSGEITSLTSVEELEGTLELALAACSDDDESDDESDEDNDNDYDSDEKYDYCHKKNKKVYICHKGKTICVSVNAIWGHLNQHEEDFLGKCE